MDFITKVSLPKSKDILTGQISGSHVPKNLPEICDLPFEGLSLRNTIKDELSDILPNPKDTEGAKIAFMLEMPDTSPFAVAAGEVDNIPLAFLVFTQTEVKAYGDLKSTTAQKKLEKVIKSLFVYINDHATEVAQSSDAAFLALEEKPRSRPRPKGRTE